MTVRPPAEVLPRTPPAAQRAPMKDRTMRAHSSTTIPRPPRPPRQALPDRPRLPKVEAPPAEPAAERFPSWLGSESDAGLGVSALDGFHLGVQGPGESEPSWEVFPASGVRIGRSKGCGVVLPDTGVSRYHAEIERLRSGRYAIRDLMSANGMRVNGQVTRQWTLNDGDVVQIGAYRLTFGGGVLPQLPAGSSALEAEPPDGVFGRTFTMGVDAERQLSERSVNHRAFLQVIGDRHRLAGLRVCQYVIECDAVVINPGGYTHTSVAIADALRAIAIPAVEVHLSNLYGREPLRHRSLTGGACEGVIMGLGADSYFLALHHLAARLRPAP